MATVHLIVGASLLAGSLAVGLWGSVAWIRSVPTVGFWYGLRVVQLLAAVQAALGLGLIASGGVAPGLHYLYGGLPLLVSLLAELVRAGAARQELGALERGDFEALDPERQHQIGLAIVRRETGIMAVACLVIFFLAVRAAIIAPGL